MTVPPFNKFMGPAFIVTCITFMMYGTFCAQVYYYWTTYNDKRAIQCLVAIITSMETVHTALCIHVFYEYLVALWGDTLSAGRIITTVTIATFFELIISSIVQGWYIYRIWRLHKQAITTGFLIAMLLAHVAISFRATAYTHRYATWEELYSDKHFLIDTNCTFGLNIALDASITSVLMAYLLRDRSKAVKRSTRKMIKSLINFAFNTGILTVLTSCGLFVAFNVAQHTITFGGMIQFIAKLYANSMLAVLNARQNVVQAAVVDDKFSMELSNLGRSAASASIRAVEPVHLRTQITSPRSLTDVDETWSTKQDQNALCQGTYPEDQTEAKVFEAARELEDV